MSIDGIGKRGGIAPGASVPGAAPAPSPFEVSAPAAAGAPDAASRASDAFEALERGEIDVAEASRRLAVLDGAGESGAPA